MDTFVSPRFRLSSIKIRIALTLGVVVLSAAVPSIPTSAASLCGTKTIITCKNGSYYCANTPGMSCANPAFTPTSANDAAYVGNKKIVPFGTSAPTTVKKVTVKWKKAWTCKKKNAKKKCVRWSYRWVKVKTN